MKDIIGYEGLYAITSCGKVWSYRKQRFLKQEITPYGYCQVVLSKNGEQKHFRVHKLVAQAYIENPDNKNEIDHIDRNRLNNAVPNLRWVSSAENKQNTSRVGEKKQFTKIRCIETGEIYKSCAAAARAIGVHVYTLNCCVNGKQKTCGGYHWERVVESEVETNE